ncbi:hypothetical protein Lsed01_00847 [Demequina sediminis]|uniref:Uncharacterized protein n=1 Tax=Demequina sediminis TaxID=1930058 RepID=A0ABP9WF51_9MICO|nr:hypothetical protein [Demequina sediminis]BDZ62499.1 hypothetical protein GCM10025873_22900 [Demequina sediminis]
MNTSIARKALAIIGGVALTGLVCSQAVGYSVDLDDAAIASISEPAPTPTWSVGEAHSVEADAPVDVPAHSGLIPASSSPADIPADSIEIVPVTEDEGGVPGETRAIYNSVTNAHGSEGGNLDASSTAQDEPVDTIWQSSKDWSSDGNAHISVDDSGGDIVNLNVKDSGTINGTGEGLPSAGGPSADIPNIEIGQTDSFNGDEADDVRVVIELDSGVTITIDAPAGSVSVGGEN